METEGTDVVLRRLDVTPVASRTPKPRSGCGRRAPTCRLLPTATLKLACCWHSSAARWSHDVVPGEVVVLNAGDVIPGDGRVLEAHRLLVDEASLTGEPYPAEKEPFPEAGPQAERRRSAYMGTHVLRARADRTAYGSGAPGRTRVPPVALPGLPDQAADDDDRAGQRHPGVLHAPLPVGHPRQRREPSVVP